MAFTRFVKRRGVPQFVISDNGTNFAGAEREMKEAADNLNSSRIASSMGCKGVKRSFNPPSSPHHGVFEAMVKCAKRALVGVLSGAGCTDEELQTAFATVETQLNRRPLTTLSGDN